ncbi:TerC family protein [Tuwongella immobilis]|uniref:TerC family protein n=1 Tax=Tuwongella immobilis TaxID=692036 RepID=A0A6C2YVK2_9BACT|nr:TerC family protein [Tuwongella immobilis]VIP05650.1 membrane protein : Integral membrane protein TerC family protein OS=Leptospira yanagawae serovar Saopaulo str. Sao Paulo = ATCC 700523 GN=LEP1GSC202_0793 PE=4 SV=1: TerC [Tuwongella immobilis]VTS08656.1 membrane protein : Integral membrane protein TerC family protein OS=Leptospira yanagawae serovar Saopaulo str. Sao Paulo = ATCC 700523 GN=LEP1GSC202_0793 PE=4 SV=1: TerC [Tuwongella immobilis]
MEWLAPLVTLTLMEIVLGIDNIIFIAIVAGRLPEAQRPRARRIGLMVALGTRLMLLALLSFIMGLTKPLFMLPELSFLNIDPEHAEEVLGISGKDLIMIIGGLFLVGKSVYEIHHKLEGPDEHESTGGTAPKSVSFGLILAQIAVIDIVFSLDSVITAVGMARDYWVMVSAMIISVGVMLAFAGYISDFVDRHPTLKILALSFLILIGTMLMAEGFGQHMNKGYIYFAMAFAVVVELLNMRLRKKADEPVALHGKHMPSDMLPKSAGMRPIDRKRAEKLGRNKSR